MPLSAESGCEALRPAYLAVEIPEQEGSKIGGQGAAGKIGTEGLPGRQEEPSVFWVRIAPPHISCGLYGMDVSHLPFYQGRTRGLCFCVKNPGQYFVRAKLMKYVASGRLAAIRL
jgi:hypothetical protein